MTRRPHSETRQRREGNVRDRIRNAVTNRIRDARRLIRKEIPELGGHLDRCVKTGATSTTIVLEVHG